mmetsp:Transcript_41395/g.81635  ORF Transcript_41395/g.81635 Transcript_41395/m.81635 type:complete len:512 (+) Transcript_41395:350-1885(+)
MLQIMLSHVFPLFPFFLLEACIREKFLHFVTENGEESFFRERLEKVREEIVELAEAVSGNGGKGDEGVALLGGGKRSNAYPPGSASSSAVREGDSPVGLAEGLTVVRGVEEEEEIAMSGCMGEENRVSETGVAQCPDRAEEEGDWGTVGVCASVSLAEEREGEGDGVPKVSSASLICPPIGLPEPQREGDGEFKESPRGDGDGQAEENKRGDGGSESSLHPHPSSSIDSPQEEGNSSSISTGRVQRTFRLGPLLSRLMKGLSADNLPLLLGGTSVGAPELQPPFPFPSSPCRAVPPHTQAAPYVSSVSFTASVPREENDSLKVDLESSLILIAVVARCLERYGLRGTDWSLLSAIKGAPSLRVGDVPFGDLQSDSVFEHNKSWVQEEEEEERVLERSGFEGAEALLGDVRPEGCVPSSSFPFPSRSVQEQRESRGEEEGDPDSSSGPRHPPSSVRCFPFIQGSKETDPPPEDLIDASQLRQISSLPVFPFPSPYSSLDGPPGWVFQDSGED